jgi:peptide-methionine (S)-S-oxide reductase
MFLLDILTKKLAIPSAGEALAGRPDPLPTAERHFVTGRPLKGPFPEGLKTVVLGLGCFWGAERILWQTPGVFVTAVGYAGGTTPNPTYQETCTGMTGHTEAVLVVYDPAVISLEALLKVFFEAHNPTQGMRQGNDVGTQYRSAIYLDDADELALARRVKADYQAALLKAGHGTVTTEIAAAGPFYYAEDYHQQYLAKNPNGYCGIGGTGVSCPIGLATAAQAAL